MTLWQILSIVGIGFILLEIFVPSMFFLNFALASFITACISYWIKNPYVLTMAFVILSFISFWFLRPILVRNLSRNQETGIESKYIGQIAKAETDINEASGVISIYGERWEARCENNTTISQGSDVRILKNDSIIMYVSEK